MNSVTVAMRSSRGRTTAAALLGTASVLALGSTPAFGQAATIVVTGSIIAGQQAVGVPITAVGEEQFLEQGAVTVADMLWSVPQVAVDASLTSLRGGGTTGYGQNVEIHGLSGSGGDAITLMLINNRRWPIQGHGGDTVDPSIIPQLAVDHVDVLTAGASATYGADAIVGVINVILKRNFEGAVSQVSMSRSVDISQGIRVSASHLHGISWDTGNVTMTVEAYFQQRVRAAAIGRDWYTTNFMDTQYAYDATPLALQMPGVISIGKPITDPSAPDGFTAEIGTSYCANCYSLPHGIGWEYGTQDPGPTTDWNAIQGNKWVVGQRNEENQRINYDDSWALPQQTREAFVGTLNQRLTDDLFGLGEVELVGTMFYSNRKGQMRFGINTNSGNSREHASFRRADTGVTIPSNNPYIPTGLLAAAGSNSIQMHINASPLLGGASRINFENIATRYEGGLNFNSLPWDWIGEAYWSMSNEENHTHTTNMINRDRAYAALGGTIKASGDYAAYAKPADVPYLNVFCDALVWGTACNSPKTLDYIRGVRFQDNQWRIRQAGVNFSGPIFELPSGEIQGALAFESLSQHYWFTDYTNAGSEPAASPGTQQVDIAKRLSHAYIAQLNIPILGGAWTAPGFEAFDVELGYRLDKFDFQDEYVKTPKVAATWTVGWGLSVRGAWGKSFRAPGFGQLSAASGSRAIGSNLAGGSGQNDYVFTCDNSDTGQPSGTALPGSATAIFNPGCLTDNANVAKWAPAGINLAGGSGLGDYARGLTGAVAAANPDAAGKGLGPETSKQYNVGFNFAPTDGILAGLNVDVSYFHIKLLDSIRADPAAGIGGIHVGDSPDARHLFIIRPSVITPGADDSSFQAIVAAMAQLPSSTSTFEAERTYYFIFDGANRNVSGYNLIEGIDFSFRYDWSVGNWGSFNIGTSGYFDIKQCSNAGGATDVDICNYSYTDINGNKVGKNSGTQLQKLRSRLGWMHPDGTWSVTLFNTWQGHQAPTTNITYPECFWAEGYGPGDCYPGSPYYPQPYGHFYNTSPGWMQWDLNLTYNTQMLPANEYLQNLNISLNVNNVLDANPPATFNSRSNAREIFARDSRWSELGRTVSLQVTKNW